MVDKKEPDSAANPRTKPAVKSLSLRLSPGMQAKILKFSTKTGFTPSQIVEAAVNKYFKDME